MNRELSVRQCLLNQIWNKALVMRFFRAIMNLGVMIYEYFPLNMGIDGYDLH